MTREEQLARSREFNEMAKKYYEHFGENYGVAYGDFRSHEEHMEEMRRCIETNTKANIGSYEGIMP